MEFYKKTQIGIDTFTYELVDRLDISDLPCAPAGTVLTGYGDGVSPSFATPTGGASIWGAITGSILDQTDLNGALNRKEPANANIQTHVTSNHAPSDAQKNYEGYVVLANDTLAQALATNINTQLTVTANGTLTTTVPPAGVRCSVTIVTSGTTSRVITFGTGFKPVGTLATGTVTARAFVVNFISNGTILREAGRTAAMVV